MFRVSKNPKILFGISTLKNESGSSLQKLVRIFAKTLVGGSLDPAWTLLEWPPKDPPKALPSTWTNF